MRKAILYIGFVYLVMLNSYIIFKLNSSKLFINLSIYTLTTSHKMIGILYFYIGYISGFLGYIISMFIRLEISTSGLCILRKVKEVTLYNNWITIHGLIMLFVFIMPVGIAYYGNYIIPLLIACSELSMPRMNGIGYFFLMIGVFMFVVSNILISKGISSGWTMYPPLSISDSCNLGFNIDLTLLVIHVLGISSSIGSVNYITTNSYNRHNFLGLFDVNIYSFSIVVTSVLLIGALPILGVSITGLLLDRNVNTSIYLLVGDPVLYEHLFWFFGHPEVYVIILPIFGLCSLILTGINHKDIFGREGMVYCLISIGLIGYLVWAHHMFTVGLDIDTRSYFSIATSIISIPTSVKIFSYLSTWASGRGLKGSNSSWCFISFIICFSFGGFTGLILSSASLDILFHDTYFVVGHFHTVLSLAATFGLLIGHNYYNSILYSICIFESLTFYHSIFLFIGGLKVFYPMHLAGMYGMARRIPEYADNLIPFTIVGFHGTLILICSSLLFIRGMHMWSSVHVNSNSNGFVIYYYVFSVVYLSHKLYPNCIVLWYSTILFHGILYPSCIFSWYSTMCVLLVWISYICIYGVLWIVDYIICIKEHIFSIYVVYVYMLVIEYGFIMHYLNILIVCSSLTLVSG